MSSDMEMQKKMQIRLHFLHDVMNLNQLPSHLKMLCDARSKLRILVFVAIFDTLCEYVDTSHFEIIRI